MQERERLFPCLSWTSGREVEDGGYGSHLLAPSTPSRALLQQVYAAARLWLEHQLLIEQMLLLLEGRTHRVVRVSKGSHDLGTQQHVRHMMIGWRLHRQDLLRKDQTVLHVCRWMRLLVYLDRRHQLSDRRDQLRDGSSDSRHVVQLRVLQWWRRLMTRERKGRLVCCCVRLLVTDTLLPQLLKLLLLLLLEVSTISVPVLDVPAIDFTGIRD